MRASVGLLTTLIATALVSIIAFLVLPGDVQAEDHYIGSNWVIDTDMEYVGDTITVRGHINIKDGGSLTLRNSTLLVDSRRGDRFRLTVEGTGNLYAYDSIIRNRYSNNNDERFFFDVHNDTILRDTTVQRLYGWNNDNPGGLRLLGGSHIIEGCTIQDSRTWGIYTRCPLIIRDTTIRWTGWSRLAIYTDGRLFDMDFYVQNCTFTGNVNDPGGYGIYLNDGYSGQFKRYINVSHCRFEGLSYGMYVRPSWQRGAAEVSHSTFDRNWYGIRIWVNDLNVHMHHNSYTVRSGAYGIRLYKGSRGNITWHNEDIRATSQGAGTGLYLEGIGSGSHLVRDCTIWNTYYGIVSTFGHTEVRDCYVNTTDNAFFVYSGATIDIYTTTHPIGSGFVDTSGGRITAWQRINVSSVQWADGSEISQGTLHLLNSTDDRVGMVNLSLGQKHLDFKRWECRRSYIWVNEEVYPAILDVDTWFRAPALDILETDPQLISFTDDYVPRLTVKDVGPGSEVNVSYLILEGGIVERGQGLVGVEVRLDDGDWTAAAITGEAWDLVYSRLADGAYDIHIRARDRAGNVAELLLDDVIIDTAPPWIELTEEPPKATNEPMLHLEGRTEPEAEVFLNHLLVEADDNGSFVIDYPMDEGANGLVLKVRDVAGNWNQSVFSVMLDTSPPSLVVRSPPDGVILDTGVVDVEGKTDEEVVVTINGIEVPTFRGGFSKELELEEGVHELVVLATDEAGNNNTTLLRVTVDLTAPDLRIDRPTQDELLTVDDTAFIAGTMDADLDYVFINGENRSALPGEFAIQVDLVEGENAFTVLAVDRAGNEARQVVVIVKDTRAPKYTVEDVTVKDGRIIQSGQDKYATAETLVFHVRVDEEAVFTIGRSSVTDSGQFALETDLAEGVNAITIEVVDLIGNIAEAFHYTIHYDPTPPRLVVTSPADSHVTHDREVLIEGTTDSGRDQVWINEVPAGVKSDGSFELTMPLELGDNTFSIRARDRAGNDASTTMVVERTEKEEVVESNTGTMAIALVVGLVIGLVVMYAFTARGRGPREPRPPSPPDRTPPERPPAEPPGGPPEGGDDSWSEY